MKNQNKHSFQIMNKVKSKLMTVQIKIITVLRIARYFQLIKHVAV